MRIGFFTAGTIGAGHLARGIALERALVRASSPSELVVVGPPSPYALADRPSYRAVAMDPPELHDPRRAPESALARALVTLAPDVLVVDLFWAPLLHILPLLPAEVWLLVRKVPADWFVGPPGHAFDRAQFGRVIGIEPGLDGVDETIDPVLAVGPDDMQPRGALRSALGLRDGDPLVVVAHASSGPECRELVARAPSRPHVFTLPRRDTVASASTFDAVQHDGARFFPLAAWLDDADAIVSGGGYNAYWELRALGLDRRTTFVPFARPIDDQQWRIRSHRDFVPHTNGADTLAAMLAR